MLGSAGLAARADDGQRSRRTDRVLVAFKENAPASVRGNAVRRLGLERGGQFIGRHLARLQVPADRAGGGLASTLAALRSDPSVRYAEPDHPIRLAATPNDPSYSQLWGLHNTGQNGGAADADIDAPEAWEEATGSPNVVVAVVDTGVDYRHPDLRDNILRDRNGAVVGYDFASDDADPMDNNEHGTHVAGTIGAMGNNGVGVVGVCHTVRIMPLKFLDASGNGYTSDAIRAVDFAVANGADIINASWGGGGFSQGLLEAIQRAEDAGILFVAAAGNESNDNDESPSYPANYNRWSRSVLTVAATNSSDTVPDFSNYGATTVDLAAPGVDIRSTTPGNRYATFSGTSMATPHVAGAAALLLARYPSLTLAQLRARLLYNTDYPSAIEGMVIHGRLNVARALASDSVAPGAPTNFTVTHRGGNSLMLRWTASGEDGDRGVARGYELRYSTAPLDASNVEQAARAANLPAPAAPGTTQHYLLPGLSAGSQYHVALYSVDNAGNSSPLALVSGVRTLSESQPAIALSDDVEGTPRFSTVTPWAITTERSDSPTHSYTDSPGGNYRSGADNMLTQSAPVTLAGFAPELTFRARLDLEADYDFFCVEVSADDGTTWQRQSLMLTGTINWNTYRVSLAPFYGQTVRVRFHLMADSMYQQDGVWLDNITIGGDRLVPVTVGPEPNAPSDLSVTPVSKSELRLTWRDNSGDETGFRIDRLGANGSFTTLHTTEAGVVEFTDSDLLAGTPYTYRVCAVSPRGVSEATVPQTGTTLSDGPAAPTALVTRVERRRVVLRWTQPSDPNIRQNRIYRSRKPAGPYRLVRTIPATSGYIDRGAWIGVPHYYVVTTVNAAGVESAYSNESGISRRGR